MLRLSRESNPGTPALQVNTEHSMQGVIRTAIAIRDQDHLHPLHRASENVASQPGIESGNSCTAGEHSMQGVIRTAIAIRDLSLCCYSSPPQVAMGDRG
jgi:hypothetical protein